MTLRTFKSSGALQSEHALDAGLFFLRMAGSFMLAYVHGRPNLINYASELTVIDDPFDLVPHVSLCSALLAELVCLLLIVFGVGTRMGCSPVILLLLVAMVAVHLEWSIAQGQFGWRLLAIFTAIALCGSGRWCLNSLFSSGFGRSQRRQDA